MLYPSLFLPGYEVDCGIYHNKIMAAVVIKDLTLLIVPHPMVRLWLTLLGFLVTAVIILLAVGRPVIHTSSICCCMAVCTTTM